MRHNTTTARILNSFIASLLWYVRSVSPCPKTQKIYANETDFSGDPATFGDSRFRKYSGRLLLVGCVQKFSKRQMGSNSKRHTFALGKNCGGLLAFVSCSNP
jgi:hypothetical protein